jgi:hypothetical protein
LPIDTAALPALGSGKKTGGRRLDGRRGDGQIDREHDGLNPRREIIRGVLGSILKKR